MVYLQVSPMPSVPPPAATLPASEVNLHTRVHTHTCTPSTTAAPIPPITITRSLPNAAHGRSIINQNGATSVFEMRFFGYRIRTFDAGGPNGPNGPNQNTS